MNAKATIFKKSSGAKTSVSAIRSVSNKLSQARTNALTQDNATSSLEEDAKQEKIQNNANSLLSNELNKEDESFVARLTRDTQSLAFRRLAASVRRQATGGASGGSGGGGTGGGISLGNGIDWDKNGAIAADLHPDHNFLNKKNGWSKFEGGSSGLDQSTLDQIKSLGGKGSFSVINSTASSMVSWMNGGGNLLTQSMLSAIKSGKSLGQVFADGPENLSGFGMGRTQPKITGGKNLPTDFGTKDNPATTAIFIADVHHRKHGALFEKDFQNFKEMAIASGVDPSNIHKAETWNEFKTLMTSKATGGNGLMVGSAAHGFARGGQGKQDFNAESGFNVAGTTIHERDYEGLIALAGSKYKNTVTINCPCHSGGFDGEVG